MFFSIQGAAGPQGDQGIQGDAGIQGADGLANYVNRGDVAGFDYELGDFTRDNNWFDLDLSSIVGAGERLIHIEFNAGATESGKAFYLRTNGNSNNYNAVRHHTQVNGVSTGGGCWVKSDASGKIEYLFAAASWSFARITVRGWFVII